VTLLPAPEPDAAPLAERMRPRRLDEVIGQDHLLAPGAPLAALIEAGHLPSLVFWGPPGVGKTTLARLLSTVTDARFLTLSAVLAGVKDIRAAVDQAQAQLPRRTVLFIDEIHRFNKSQQDALLPFVESGALTLIGATTENPSFELNSALLSRLRVMVLNALDTEALGAMLQRGLTDPERGLGLPADALPADVMRQIAEAADGDGRRGLILLETVVAGQTAGVALDDEGLQRLIGRGLRRFDKQGEQFYDQISALHKSVRGSDPDAALYWLARMLDGGCDPAYLIRRITRMASEDIGLADPRALPLCIAAWEAFDRQGSPEGELAIAEAVVYLACAPKSNAAYVAYKAARKMVAEHGTAPVPMHLRNAPTRLMKSLGYGQGYQYDPDAEGGHAHEQTYWPEGVAPQVFYQPVNRGLEIRIGEKLAQLRAQRGGS
jgi:putative ATPase